MLSLLLYSCRGGNYWPLETNNYYIISLSDGNLNASYEHYILQKKEHNFTYQKILFNSDIYFYISTCETNKLLDRSSGIQSYYDSIGITREKELVEIYTPHHRKLKDKIRRSVNKYRSVIYSLDTIVYIIRVEAQLCDVQNSEEYNAMLFSLKNLRQLDKKEMDEVEEVIPKLFPSRSRARL